MITVYLDGDCLYCRATARLIKRLDLFRRINVTSFRTDLSYQQYGLNAEQVSEAMHLVDETDRGVNLHVGYDAILKLLRLLVLLWPLYPFAWLIQRVGLGNRFYQFLADNRIFVSDARHCKDGICEL